MLVPLTVSSMRQVLLSALVQCSGEVMSQILASKQGRLFSNPQQLAWDYAKSTQFFFVFVVIAYWQINWYSAMERIFPFPSNDADPFVQPRYHPVAHDRSASSDKIPFEIDEKNIDSSIEMQPTYWSPKKPSLRMRIHAMLPVALVVVKRVALDQLVLTPLYLCLFHGLVNLFSGQPSFETLRAGLIVSFWPALLMSWRVWPLIQTITYGILPPHMRLVFVSIVNVFWVMFLTSL